MIFTATVLSYALGIETYFRYPRALNVDAPVGLVITLERDLPVGAWLDTGMFLQNVMLAARAFGLDTCPQAAIASAHTVLRRELAIPQGEIVVCGMSLGYARADAVENTLVTEREPVAGFARFLGF